MDEMDMFNQMLNETAHDPSPPPVSEASPHPAPAPSSEPASESTPPAVVRMQNRVIERARQLPDFQQDRLPSSEIACSICPLATWVRAGDTLKAHCSKMFLVVWTSDEQNDLTDCSAQEEALLQLQ